MPSMSRCMTSPRVVVSLAYSQAPWALSSAEGNGSARASAVDVPSVTWQRELPCNTYKADWTLKVIELGTLARTVVYTSHE